MIRQIDLKQAAERLEKGEDVKILIPEDGGDWSTMRPMYLRELLEGALFFGEEDEPKPVEPAKMEGFVNIKEISAEAVERKKTQKDQFEAFVDEVCAMGKKEEPKKKPKYDHFEIMAMYDHGAGPTEIAREIGCSPQTVINILTKEGVYKK